MFLSSEEWLERAKTFAKESDWIQAYRALFIATLLLLDTAHFIPFEKHRTNGEYLHLLAKLPLLYPLLAPAIWQFDTHRYGGRTVSQSDYSHSLALYEKLIPLTTNPTRGQVTAEAE